MGSATWFFIFKAVLSGLIVAAVSTIARYFPKWAAFLTALPLITFLSLIWIYFERKDLGVLETYVWDVFLWTLPGLLFFLAATLLFRARLPFVLSLVASCLIMGLGLFLFHKMGVIKD